MGEPQSQVGKASTDELEEKEEEIGDEANRVGSTNGIESGGERGEEIEERREALR
ncbi:unnamed protein product [Fusarium graminearum]|uniref:Chromosome 1, complete genome n=1 Tax=Gibberella zeae (strain ATCC MYA-4620 / CBS 123657 / FGSC 9075 / NRRL 31084 / PH-1) TaxID=229533 RepID=A0A098D9A0_GIBZE|nr:unnamed protein product [Fusarium graminearum]CZS78797.1 unnamed protein product [Fusarium graminearum]